MINLREITDISELMKWRSDVIKEVFGESASADLLGANRKYYESHIVDGRHLAFVASIDGEDVGCGGICFTEELPSPDNTNGCCAYLMNIYVRESYRCHGIAHAIVERLIAEAVKRDCKKIYLEATDDGVPVYQSLGFQSMNGMMKLNQK